ncbi:hypothetical protein GS415_03330 [Rhodococcus hoagii]|nr:hypothetical protein [Prescottella equi]NKU01768.1 hypothetical protein [Prescottella equi]
MGKGYSTTASTPGGNLVLVDPRPGRVDAEFALAIDRPELVEDHQSREPLRYRPSITSKAGSSSDGQTR